MKRICLLMLLLSTSLSFGITKNMVYQQGTVIRMRMAECMVSHHFMATMSGGAKPESDELCPEYTLMTEKVVYVIVGKSSNQLIPLAENVDFRFQKNELAVRIDAGGQESRFTIREMALRSEWEQTRQRADEVNSWVRRHVDTAVAMAGPR